MSKLHRLSLLYTMSHDYYLPDPINGPKDVSGFPLPLCRKCGEWKGNAEDKCPISTTTKVKKARKSASSEHHGDNIIQNSIIPMNLSIGSNKDKRPRKNPHQLHQAALESGQHKISHLVDLEQFAHVRGMSIKHLFSISYQLYAFIWHYRN